MNPLRKTLVLAAVLASVLAGVAPAGAEETVIHNGETISGFRGTTYSPWFGRIHVPVGARKFIVTTSGGSGDCDLYLRREQTEDGSWDFQSRSNNNDDRIALAFPAAGGWQV
jgi:hypothetical protein